MFLMWMRALPWTSFRADIYGQALIDNLTEKQKSATADEMMEYLTGKSGFSIALYGEDAYTKEELEAYDLPEELSKQEILDLAIMRYELSTNSFKKYMAVTIATNVSEQSVAAIKENQTELQGIDIVEDSVRKYIDDPSLRADPGIYRTCFFRGIDGTA